MKLVNSFAAFVCFAVGTAAAWDDFPAICDEIAYINDMSPRAQSLVREHCVGHPLYCTAFPCIGDKDDSMPPTSAPTLAPTSAPVKDDDDDDDDKDSEDVDCNGLMMINAMDKPMRWSVKKMYKEQCIGHPDYCTVFSKTFQCRKAQMASQTITVNCDELLALNSMDKPMRWAVKKEYKKECKSHPDYCSVFSQTHQCRKALMDAQPIVVDCDKLMMIRSMDKPMRWVVKKQYKELCKSHADYCAIFSKTYQCRKDRF